MKELKKSFSFSTASPTLLSLTFLAVSSHPEPYLQLNTA